MYQLLQKFTCLLLGSCLLMVACNQPNAHNMERINRLSLQLDSTNQVVATLNFEEEEARAQKIKQDLEFIQTNFTDTLTQQTAILLTSYKSINEEEEEEKATAGKQEVMLKKELDFTKMQLLNLKHDAEKTDLSKEQFEKYFESESTAVSKISAFVLSKKAEFTRHEEQFKQLQPKVQLVIDSLKK